MYFYVLLIIIGYIIGLGAVTVIDLHGLLARKSPYWTQATIQTHKVTKPLIWLGIVLILIGNYFYFSIFSFPLEFYTLLKLYSLLILNGIYLSFWLSPRLLKREKEGREKELLPNSWIITTIFSLIISIIGWWGSLFYFVFILVK